MLEAAQNLVGHPALDCDREPGDVVELLPLELLVRATVTAMHCWSSSVTDDSGLTEPSAVSVGPLSRFPDSIE